MTKYGKQIYQARVKPTVNPQAGTALLFFDSNNSNKLSVLHSDGHVDALESLIDSNKIMTASTTVIPKASASGEATFNELNAVKILRSNKDSNDVYTTIEWFDSSNVVRIKSVMSGGTSPLYTTRTLTYYNIAGTLIYTKVFTQQYDGEDWIGEVAI